MGLFSKAKEKEELALVFDIRSSSVGGSIFCAQKNSAPKMIFSIREPIIFEEKIDFERFLYLTIKALDIVVNKMCMAGQGTPKKIYCVLSSPWYASQTRSIVFNKNTPFVFTSKLADGLIQKEIGLFEEEYLKKYKHIDDKIKLLEFKNMSIVLNGYETAKPLKQKAKELGMTVFVSVGEEQVLNKIQESINKHFHGKEVKFLSFLMTSFAVARDVFVHEENFLLVDVGGEITDISMVKKNILRSSVSFPLGRNFFIRGIKTELACSLDEAKSFMSLFKDGHAFGAVNEKLKPVVLKLKREWLKKFQESLASITNDISIPSVVFVTVEEDLAQFFIETIKTEEFNQYSLTDSKFKIVFLGNQALHGIVLFGEDTIRDPFLILESIYINRFLS